MTTDITLYAENDQVLMDIAGFKFGDPKDFHSFNVEIKRIRLVDEDFLPETDDLAEIECY